MTAIAPIWRTRKASRLGMLRMKSQEPIGRHSRPTTKPIAGGTNDPKAPARALHLRPLRRNRSRSAAHRVTERAWCRDSLSRKRARACERGVAPLAHQQKPQPAVARRTAGTVARHHKCHRRARAIAGIAARETGADVFL